MITIRIAESREDKKIADQIVILHHSYLADNWKAIGETAGLPAGRKSVSMKWDSSEEMGLNVWEWLQARLNECE